MNVVSFNNNKRIFSDSKQSTIIISIAMYIHCMVWYGLGYGFRNTFCQFVSLEMNSVLLIYLVEYCSFIYWKRPT